MYTSLFQHNFPRTLEALILHMLSPVGAEVLTQKFDGIDQQTSEEDRYRLLLQWLLNCSLSQKITYWFLLNFILLIVYLFRNNFYQAFYGAFDDQFAAMDAILTGKESFAHQVVLWSWITLYGACYVSYCLVTEIYYYLKNYIFLLKCFLCVYLRWLGSMNFLCKHPAILSFFPKSFSPFPHLNRRAEGKGYWKENIVWIWFNSVSRKM